MPNRAKLRSITRNHRSGWESFDSFADRISAVGYTLQVLKQTLRDLTVATCKGGRECARVLRELAHTIWTVNDFIYRGGGGYGG